MKKVVIKKPGGFNTLKLISCNSEILKKHQCRIKVKYAGVNFADTAVRQGLYASAKALGFPITPGFEVSGSIIEIGTEIKKFKVGDKVWGITKFGGYTSEICLDEQFIFKTPDHLSCAEIASIPTIFLTAYHALFQNVIVRPNMTVLVHSASGGVGTALLQLLNIIGCTSIGIVGGDHKVAMAKENGAKYVINRKTEDLWKRTKEICPEGFDIILDAVGPDTLKKGYAQLKPTGKMISYGFASMMDPNTSFTNWFKLIIGFLKIPRFNPLNMVSENKSIVCFNLSFLFDRQDLIQQGANAIQKWLTERKISAPKISIYKAEDVSEAHRDIESGKTTGKLLLEF